VLRVTGAADRAFCGSVGGVRRATQPLVVLGAVAVRATALASVRAAMHPSTFGDVVEIERAHALL
jgi:hypothetical protein